MRTHWQIKSLDDLVTEGIIQLGRGKVISKKDLRATPGPYPVYSSAKNNEGKFGEYGKYMFDEEMITWSVDGGGRIFHRERHKFSVTNVGGTMKILDESVLNYRFLYYILTCLHARINFDWVLKAHPSVVRKLYKTIPIPPLPEQKRIVAILDEAFAAIDKATANAEKNLANARELFEAHVNGFFAKNAFSQRGKLADFVEGILTGPFGSVLHKSDYVENEIPVVNPVNIVGTSILPDAKKTVSTTTRMQLDAYTLRDGDVVIARRGEIGRCAVVSKHQDGWLCGTGCFVIRPSPKTVPEFLCHLLRSQPYREALERQSGRATMPSLSNKQLAKLPIGLPAVPQQEKAISIFNALWQETERLAQVYERKRSFITELRQSILQKAFAGELTATAVEEEITV